MADIELVVKIPEEIYTHLLARYKYQNTYDIGLSELDKVGVSIKNGTPLPQPFDLDGLKSDMKALNCGYPYGLDYLLDCLKKRLGITIIEADKEGESK